MIDVEKSAKKFIKEFVSHDVDCDLIEGAIKNQGYTIIYFRSFNNDEDVDVILKKLELEEMAIRSRGFVYADDRYRLVFVNDDLTENEKLLILLHEEGHIYLEHTRNHKVIGLDVVEEHEANEFVHYVLHPDKMRSVAMFVKKHKKAFIGFVAIILLTSVGILSYRHYRIEQTYYEEFYVTRTGEKYHLRECSKIEGKEVRRLTQKDMEEGKHDPCSICIGKSAP